MKIVYVFAIVLLAVVACSQLAMAQIPRTISYQGVLADNAGTPKPDGSYQLTFRLYNVGSEGSALWTEVKTLLTTRGLFSTALGDQVPIPYSIKFDQPYWLGIQVAADPELTTRIPLTAVGYSFNSSWADTARVGLVNIEKLDTLVLGSPTQDGRIIVYKNGSPNPIVDIKDYSNSGGSVIITDELGNNVGRFRPSGMGTGGTVEVYRNTAGSLGFYAGGNNYGDEEPYVRVYGSQRLATFYMGAAANASVVLPDSSISAAEILDEPGIAGTYDAGGAIATTGVTNVASASITVPGPGYIVARASGMGAISGTSIGAIYMGIETAPTTSPSPWTIFGSNNEALSSSQIRWGSMVFETTFLVSSSGTHSYYMNATHSTLSDGAGYIYYAKLMLTYYPTSYGTVTSAVPLSEAQKFESATPIEMSSDASGSTTSTEKMYKVDLRELELKAAKARAAAEKAERELMEAKMNDQIGSVSPDKR